MQKVVRCELCHFNFGDRFGLISETKVVPITVMIETVEYDGMMSVSTLLIEWLMKGVLRIDCAVPMSTNISRMRCSQGSVYHSIQQLSCTQICLLAYVYI